ncbi:uncharacterized protein LOC120838403 [Ixodes scapularis]|uniref:uncharacterized protein LOC120838403 n=1 Tax=Ixodes scapularis TaxID=6945 RepID=UPI001A9F9304|nr:uncharacterized protein LOC120838403 [Ixodes scapularis]
MVNLHQLACALIVFSLIVPEAGLVPFSCASSIPSSPPTALLLEAVTVLDKLGRRLAELEAEVAFFGICLRKRYVDPELFKHLSASASSWSNKKILRTYRDGASQRIQDVRNASDRLWFLLLGKDFRQHRDFQNWNDIKRAHFNRTWCVKRKHVLDSVKRLSACGRMDGRLVDRNLVRQMCQGVSHENSYLDVPHASIVNPCREAVSRKTEEFLSRGPKFCLNVKPSRLDVFSSIQTVAKVVTQDEKAAFVDQAIGRMENVMGRDYPTERRNFSEVKAVKNELDCKSLEMLQTDKTGKFAVLPKPVFRKKAKEALDSLFVEWTGNIGKLRKEICGVLREEEFEGTAKGILSSRHSTLSLRFFLKDHKPELPFRTVINENGTWQKVVSKFLQQGLEYVRLEDSLSLRNSNELIDILEVHHGRKCSIFSMDIKDLYYSLEKSRLLKRVKEALERNLVKFQSGSGISVDCFLTVLDLYLRSTVVEYDGKKFVQKDGVCIGSSVAPALAEIYLNSLDSAVVEGLGKMPSGSCIVRRYVDDIVVCTFQSGIAEKLESLIVSSAPELKFTVEKQTNNRLQFLDLKLHVGETLCWEYGKDAPKPVLPKKSCHSKTVKASVVRSLFTNALNRSCVHFVASAVRGQWQRLMNAGYEEDFIARQMTLMNREKEKAEEKSRNRIAVMPYFHTVSHNIKACAKKFGVNVVFSSDFKLGNLTPFQREKKGCQKGHREKSVPCEAGVVYDIPMTCGFKYIGQTSRCLNDRLTEHKRNVKIKSTNSEIATHVQECRNCSAEWSGTTVVCKEINDVKRVVKETVKIRSIGNCISQASMLLSDRAKAFLRV